MKEKQIADILKEISTFLQLKGENPFRVRAYDNAARIIETLDRPIKDIIDNEGLTSIDGIGPDLAAKIEALVKTGKLEFYDALKASISSEMIELLGISSLGPKKIYRLNKELGVTSIDSLREVCEEGKVAILKGFGVKTQDNLLNAIKLNKEYSQRYLWWDANELASQIVSDLSECNDVLQISIAGSLRRKKEVVKDIDIIASSSAPSVVMERFISLPLVQSVTSHGDTKSSVRLETGMQVDLRMVPDDQFAFALHHFTGSKEHNVQMRQRALSRGLSLSEWGFKDKEGFLVNNEIRSEESLFKYLDLQYIPPEIREARGEIEAAQDNSLPNLIEYNDIKGVFHNHTNYSDGHNTLEEMVDAAQKLNFEYIGISDHSKSSYEVNGLSEERLYAQIEEIRKINKSKLYSTHVFSGVECDILKDGRMDYDDTVLADLDFVVASVHNSLSMSEDDMTKRIIKALENPYVTMLGHVTGRILLSRESYKVNVEKVIDAAIANGKIIELNARPKRLDMDWRYWRSAVEKGLQCSINPDAHHIDHLAYYKVGVNVARKGWLTKENVINTQPLGVILRLLKSTG